MLRILGRTAVLAVLLPLTQAALAQTVLTFGGSDA